MTKLKDMSQSDLISWISGLTLGFKNDIITGITSYAEEAEMEIEGSMFVSAGVDDIKEITGLSQVRAISFMKKIAAKKKSDYDTTAPTNNNNNNASSTRIISFTLKVQGKKTYNIPGANKTWTISKCKYEFLRYIGSDGKAELYATHANQKWVSPNKKEGIELKREGKNLSDNVTLDSIGIFNGMHMPLVTTFRVNGGADEKECAEDEYDKIRPRKLNKKLLKDSGVPLSSKPCCIMGYSDIDGILRAEMPCGCSFASDTMFQYMKSLFDKNLKAVKPICPVSKGNGKYDCRGNDKQREWQWGLVFAVADFGSDGKAELYAAHANQKWVSPNKKEGIELKREGKNLSDDVTLDSLNIFNGIHMPLVTTFRVNGGAESKENEQDEYDKIRPRKLNKKLLKDAGVPLSLKPDCIMGYSDVDGILRAEMPCQCSFAADTMFRYMKSLFDKNLKAVKPICPVSKDECRGNDKQREWQWGLVFAVADFVLYQKMNVEVMINNENGNGD
eukprot:CAMPEP_0201593382 /NCGR_PEP_ID=MMETSP0190_2-20130828/190996_1 /ASSEMBLY_ACC=CAM_ASM_000263 /TAXON_ID=37353 /ORGANISM="Rosalina sp." /LENGTH=502 /DNA_ID=CAMNT_0048052541 /DNA_START=593 /DNA_END=2102 /DNA_ORIENTATION=-